MCATFRFLSLGASGCKNHQTNKVDFESQNLIYFCLGALNALHWAENAKSEVIQRLLWKLEKNALGYWNGATEKLLSSIIVPQNWSTESYPVQKRWQKIIAWFLSRGLNEVFLSLSIVSTESNSLASWQCFLPYTAHKMKQFLDKLDTQLMERSTTRLFCIFQTFLMYLLLHLKPPYFEIA